MVRTLKISLVIGMSLGLFLLSACSSAAPSPTSTPTLDLNPLRTEVAATVLAQVTRDLALTPSATSIPSPTVTNTQTLTPTPALPISGSPSPATTLTTSTPITATRDLAEWVSQSIADGAIFTPGEAFTITWQLKNVGTSTWSVTYLLRFYSGDTFGALQELPIGQIIAPGQVLDISIPMKAPTRPGDYRSDWVLANESRSNFKEPVFLKITVAAPATARPTATTAP